MRTDLICRVLKSSMIFAVIMLLTVASSCEKEEDEKTFSDFTLNDIKALESEMVTSNLVISDAGGVKWNAGDIIFYITSEGRYGKFEVVSVSLADNYKLTINAVTFDADGAVYNEADAFVVRGTWLCDLDEMVEGNQEGIDDFKNNRATETDTYLSPYNSAAFVRFTR